MHQPIDTTADGCAFTLRVGYDGKCYVENCGTGGAHFPATTILEIYQV